jgi:hypothetical protein
MVAPRRVIALPTVAGQRQRLLEISRSRTEPTSRVERARIILAYLEEPSAYEVARTIGVTHQTVTRCLQRAAELGVIEALDDRPRAGHLERQSRLRGFDLNIKRKSNNQMRGGRRPGSGRKKGSPTTRYARSVKEMMEIREEAAISGMTPLQVLLHIMRIYFQNKEWDKAAENAARAAPFMQAKLISTQVSIRRPDEMTDDELQAYQHHRFPIS